MTPGEYLKQQCAIRLTEEVKAGQNALPCAMCEARRKGGPIPKPSLNHCEKDRQVQLAYSRDIGRATTPEQLDEARRVAMEATLPPM